MLYILWGLLNLSAVIGFLIISFYAIKQVRVRYGLFVAFLFLCFFFSFTNKSADIKPSPKRMLSLDFKESAAIQFEDDGLKWFIDKSLTSHYTPAGSKRFVVYKTSLFSVGLRVTYAKDEKSNLLFPVFADPTFEGFRSGIDWKPNRPTVNIDNKKGTIEYQLDGTMKWNLLNMSIYSELKTFKGSVPLSE